MKRYFAFLLFCLIASSKTAAQEKHFIFIQAENNQPFYVQLNNNIFSSTANGYLNIAQLLQGKYYFVIGFPKNIFPEQKFVIDVHDGEAGTGYTLKQSADKSWLLINYISEAVIAPDKIEVKPIIKEEVKPEVEETKVIVQESAKPTVAIPVVSSDTKTISSIIKTYDKKSAQGIDQVYINKTSVGADTVAIFIPYLSQSIDKKSEATQSKLPTTTSVVISKENITKKCNVIATNEDFYRLRLDMAAATTDSAMVNAGKKAFVKKCFTVEQIKNLGVLFLSEQSRYNFFKEAKAHISDEQNFANLSSQFASPDIAKKFTVLTQSN